MGIVPWYERTQDDDETHCASCSWSGFGRDTAKEPFTELLEVSCPACGSRIELAPYATEKETINAAATGNPEAIEALRSLRDPRRLHRLAAKRAETTDDLPTLNDERSARILIDHLEDDELDSPWLVISANQSEIWREPAFWEDVEGGERLIALLWTRYGDIIEEIEISNSALMWFCGDRLANIPRIEGAAHRPGKDIA